MTNLLNTKNVLTLIGVVSLIEGVVFYFGAEMITKDAFPENLLEGGSLSVGTLMHQALASSMLVIGIIILSARNIETTAANKILNGVAVSFLIFLASGLMHLFTTDVQPPIPALVLMAVFALLAFYTANKKAG